MVHQVREKIQDHAKRGYLQPLNAAPQFSEAFGGRDLPKCRGRGEQAKQAKPSTASRAERSIAKLSRAEQSMAVALWSRGEQSSAKSSGAEQSGAAKSISPLRKSQKRSAI